MIRLGLEHIQQLSFPDFNVTGVKFDPACRYLEIAIDGAFFEDRSKGKLLNYGKLCFSHWEDFKAAQYNSTSDNWSPLPLNCIDNLKDICGFKYIKGKVYIEGFGKTSGLWTQLVKIRQFLTCQSCAIFLRKMAHDENLLSITHKLA